MTTVIDNKTLAAVLIRLQEVGLNLATALSAEALGPDISRQTLGEGTLLLLGNGGQEFWEVLNQDKPSGADPVDRYSAIVSEKVLNECLPNVPRSLLFPSDDCPVYLQRLMTRAGWHTPSPLGIGMHAEYGLWNACRAVWWLGASTQTTPSAMVATDHCADCLDKPCLAQCPAEALSVGQAPDLGRCADYRLAESSTCERSCMAREACPVAANHRYTPEQLNYHYELARSAIVRYRSGSDVDGGE